MHAAIFGNPNPAQDVIDQYRVDLHVSAATPPTFIWHTADDQVVPAHNALLFAGALEANQVPFELHIFDTGVHGLALADETTEVDGQFVNQQSQIWIELALNWLDRQRQIHPLTAQVNPQENAK